MTRKVRRCVSSVGFCELVTLLVIIIYMFYVSILVDNADITSGATHNYQAIPLFSIPEKQIHFNTTSSSNIGLKTRKVSSSSSPNFSSTKCSVTIAVILCEDDRYLAVVKNITGSGVHHLRVKSHKPVAKDFSRQINQTLVLLKSIAILSKYEKKSCSEVLILSDKSHHYKQIKSEIEQNWSIDFQQFVQLTSVSVRYPPGSAWMKKMFRPCATLRLFLPELLPVDAWDSVIYLDTDVIFLQSVQALWSQFKRFDDALTREGSRETGQSKKLAAMAPCLFHYGSSANEVPYYGTSGLNAGVMLMNLTRMRSSQWTNKIRMVTTMFQNKIKLADQDILNIYFHFFPEELHLLTCDWNFRPFQCREGNACEDPEIAQGISALHGNALSFTAQGPEPLFHTVFHAFHAITLNANFSMKQFVEHLESALVKVEEATNKYNSQCKRFGGLDVLLLNRMYGLVEQ